MKDRLELEKNARKRLGEVLEGAVDDAKKRGFEVRCVGSLGVYGLLGTEPKILRRTVVDSDGQRFTECVDIDLLVGSRSGDNPLSIKEYADKWWSIGMSSDFSVRFPVSVVNLPRSVANDPSAVLGFRWNTDKKRLGYQYSDGHEKDLPYWIVGHELTGSIFGARFPTLTPEGHIFFKTVVGNRNPLRMIKNITQIVDLVRGCENLDTNAVLAVIVSSLSNVEKFGAV